MELPDERFAAASTQALSHVLYSVRWARRDVSANMATLTADKEGAAAKDKDARHLRRIELREITRHAWHRAGPPGESSTATVESKAWAG